MPIKIIDTIEPINKNFKVVDASNVSYKNSSLDTSLGNLYSNFKEIEDIVKAEPTLRYKDTLVETIVDI